MQVQHLLASSRPPTAFLAVVDHQAVAVLQPVVAGDLRGHGHHVAQHGLVALLGLLWVAGHPRGAGRLVGRSGWRRYLGAVHLGIVAFHGRRAQAVRVLAAGVGFQFLQCVSVWCAARALRIDEVTLVASLAFFPPTAVLQNFPLALGGLGVREAAFVLFFGALGVSHSAAIGLGLLVYVVFVLTSLAGAPSFARGGLGGRPRSAGRGPRPAGQPDVAADPE